MSRPYNKVISVMCGMNFETKKYNHTTRVEAVQLLFGMNFKVFFLLLQFGVILSVRVEEINSCVDGIFLSILLNKIFLFYVFPRVGVLPGIFTKNICVSCVWLILQCLRRSWSGGFYFKFMSKILIKTLAIQLFDKMCEWKFLYLC